MNSEALLRSLAASMSDQAAPTGLELWKLMVNGHCLHEVVKAKSAVLVVGPMGTGKSTAIAIQTGAKYELKNEDVDGFVQPVYRCIESDERIPQVSDGFTSKTLNIGVYRDFEGTPFLDTAGINEDRSAEHRMWTEWSLSTVLRISPSIKCVLLTLNYQSLVADRGSALRGLAKSVRGIVGDGAAAKPFYESMAFLVINGRDSRGQPVSAEYVCKVAENHLEEYKKNFVEFLKRTVRQGEQQTDNEQKDMRCVITLLHTLANARGRVHMSFPDTPRKSDEQRIAVGAMIKMSTPIGEDELKKIVDARTTGHWEVLQILAKLVIEPFPHFGRRSYTDIVRQRCDNLDQLRSYLTEEDQRLQDVKSDWQSVRRELIDREDVAREEQTKEMRKTQEKQFYLQHSFTPTVVHSIEVKQSRPASGWWLFALIGGGWHWGKQSAVKTINHKGVKFEKYSLAGGDYEYKVLRNEPSQGCLEIEFTSTPGVDLNLEVKLFQQLKDMEESKHQVAALGRQIEEWERQLPESDNKITSLRVANSAEALVDILLSKKRAMERIDKDFDRVLARAVPNLDVVTPPSEWSVLAQLGNLCAILTDESRHSPMLPSDLPGPTRDALTGFTREYRRMEALLGELKQVPGADFLRLRWAGPVSGQREDAPPVRPSMLARLRTLDLPAAVKGHVSSVVVKVCQHPVASALALLTHAVLLKVGDITSFKDVWANWAISFVVFVLGVYCWGIFWEVRIAIHHVLRRLEGSVGEGIRACGKLLLEAVDRLSQGMPKGPMVKVF